MRKKIYLNIQKELFLFFISLAMVGVLLISLPVQAAEWPTFQGGTAHNGVTPYAILPPLKLVWRFSTDGDISASPIYVKNKIFLASEDANLYAINPDNGKLVWRFKVNKPLRSTPTFVDDSLVFGCDDEFLYKISGADGSLLWKINLGGKISASPLIA